MSTNIHRTRFAIPITAALALLAVGGAPKTARADHEGVDLLVLGSALVGAIALPGLVSGSVNTAIAVRSGFDRNWRTFGKVSAILNIAASVLVLAGSFTFFRDYLGETHPGIVAWGVGHLGIGVWNLIGATSQKERPPPQRVSISPAVAPTQRGGIAAGLTLSIRL